MGLDSRTPDLLRSYSVLHSIPVAVPLAVLGVQRPVHPVLLCLLMAANLKF